jgi:serine/threonine protein kinase
MEYFPLGDLQTYLNDADQPLPETEVQQIVYQILEGLKFMHTNGFAHRDIKPAVSIYTQLRKHKLNFVEHSGSI